MTSDGLRAHVTVNGREQALTLTDETSIDDAQASGRWISSADTVEIKA